LTSILSRRARISFVLAAIGSIVIALVDGLAVGLVLPLINSVTGRPADTSGVLGQALQLFGDPGAPSFEARLTVTVVVLFIVKDVLTLAFTWWVNGLIFGEKATVSSSILDHVLHARLSQVASRSAADVVRVVDTAVSQVFSSVITGLVAITTGAITTAVIVTALLLAAPTLTVMLICYLTLVALVFAKFAKPLATRSGAIASQATVEGYRTALAALGGIKEIRLRSAEETFVSRYRKAQQDGSTALRMTLFLGVAPRYVLEVFFILAIGGVVFVGRDETSSSVALIALFVAAGFRVMPSVTQILAGITGLRFGSEFVALVADEITRSRNEELLQRADDPTTSPIGFEKSIDVDDVWFRYPDADDDVLRGVSLQISKGALVALVGGSGAGKTTLVDVIAGLHRPDRGVVLVDGMPIRSHRTGWGHSVGYVAQDTFLLDSSLAQNVAFELDDARVDRDRVDRALQSAELGDLVDDLPLGIDSQLGERGARLSGGQRQRVGIARALYRSCPLLVLDEATSSLDNETEHRIQSSMARLRGEVTLLVIAHRLSTVRHADVVVLLDSGKVAAQGTFDELLRTNETFANLVRLGSLEPTKSTQLQ
jgi:ABC-type multidrug transport system fused ATPase/permease subunit